MKDPSGSVNSIRFEFHILDVTKSFSEKNRKQRKLIDFDGHEIDCPRSLVDLGGTLWSLLPFESDHEPSDAELAEVFRHFLQIDIQDWYFSTASSAMLDWRQSDIGKLWGAISSPRKVPLAFAQVGGDSGDFFTFRGMMIVSGLMMLEAAIFHYKHKEIDQLVDELHDIHSIRSGIESGDWADYRANQKARRGGIKKNRENRDAKKMAVEYYHLHRGEYSSRISAARYISGKIVGYTERVVDRWLAESEKDNQ